MNEILNTANENCFPRMQEVTLVPVISCLIARLSCDATKPAFWRMRMKQYFRIPCLIFERKSFRDKEYFFTRSYLSDTCILYITLSEFELHGNGKFYSCF